LIKEGIEGGLEPRTSFRVWSEVIAGKSREWTETEVESATVLCLVYGKFIEVWRQKEAAIQSSQLTKLLLANSAHEFRTPLNAIINYLEIALEGQIDPEIRDNLTKSHSASKSLIYVINDLLDLTKTEESQTLLKAESFDLSGCVREAAEMFEGDAKRKQLDYKIIENTDVPRYVIGDQRRVRQVISNVIANAIQYTTDGAVKIELGLAERAEDRIEIEIAVQDTGVGMSPEKLDCLFRDLEQVQSASEEELQRQIVPEHDLSRKDHNQQTLGLGLAIVARIIRNMNGRLGLTSEEGKGSRFVIQLNFELPNNDRPRSLLTGPPAAGVSVSHQLSTPTFEEGEILLVDKSPHKITPSAATRIVTRHKSNDSINSLRSQASLKSFRSGSSIKSNVDRLISAIQEPLMVAKTATETDASLQISGGNRPNLPSRRSSTIPWDHSSLIASPTVPEGPAPGEPLVGESRTPIRPARIPPEVARGNPFSGQSRAPASFLFDGLSKFIQQPKATEGQALHVLVAEDDPINSKIMKKRLEKQGHSVYTTVNGEECSNIYGERPELFDVVLMDMQVCSVRQWAHT
jgi:signal transduction histidine kinase